MKERNSTFVAATTEDARLELATMPPFEGYTAQDIDPASVFSRTPITTHERRDALTEARAFLLKYIGLTVILLVLAVGLTMRLEWNFATGVLIFAGLSTAAYWLLGYTEAQFTGPGVERHRLSIGGRVLIRHIEANERVQLARLQIHAAQLDAQQQTNSALIESHRQRARAQLEAHSTAQTHANRLVTHTPATFAVEDLERPVWATGGTQTPHATHTPTDTPRAALLDFVADVYSNGAMDAEGYIGNGTPIPWGKRGGHTATERRQMVDLLRASGLATFDDAKRAWRINTRLYPDAEAAIDALAMHATRAG